MIVHFGGVYTVNGAPVPFPPKSMLVAPAGARCQIERTNIDDLTQFWVKFCPAPEGEMVMAVPQVHPMGAEFDYYDEMFRRSLDLLPLTKAMVSTVALSLMWSASQVAATTPEDPALAAAEAVIQKSLAKNIEISELAESVGVSPAKLYAMFRDHRGQTPVEYIRTLRMQFACAMLTRTDLPVKEVAARTGYSDLQRFNKVIRETFGCSPRTLRKEQPDLGIHASSRRDFIVEKSIRRSEEPRV